MKLLDIADQKESNVGVNLQDTQCMCVCTTKQKVW